MAITTDTYRHLFPRIDEAIAGGSRGRDPGGRTAVIDHSGEALPIGILTTHHAWSTWTELAIRHERDALRARENRDIYEYRPGLIAITSSAFAIDALTGVARGLIPNTGTKARRGSVAVERLKRGVSPGKLAQSWPGRIGGLFKLRREAVHFSEESVAPVWHEAYQTNVDPSVIRWGADAATSAVDLTLEVLEGWATHPSRYTSAWAAQHAPGVRALVDLRSELAAS